MGEPLTLEGWDVDTWTDDDDCVTTATQGEYRIRGRWSRGNPNNWVLDVEHHGAVIARGRRSFTAAHRAALRHQSGKNVAPPPPDRMRPAALRRLAADLQRLVTEIERAARDPRNGRSGYPTRAETIASVVEDVDRLVAPYRFEQP